MIFASTLKSVTGQPEAEKEVPSVADPKAESGAVNSEPSTDSEEKKSDEYTETMQKKMNTGLTYRHEDGINWHDILPDLIVGSCLQTAEDVDRLADAGVTSIYCLQEDSDMAYFSLDITPIQQRCEERGDIHHHRFRIRDFDPYDLRRKLPKAVSKLARFHKPSSGGKVYIHCTAGLGRAPAVALAYMFWLRDWDLDAAFDHLRALRPCSPKIDAVRSATSDLLLGIDPIPVTIAMSRTGTAKTVQISGLDVGWNTQLDLHMDPKTDRFVLTRPLLPGSYQYKFIIDGVWSASLDHPTVQDGNNINNVVIVAPKNKDEALEAAQQRYLRPGCVLTKEERAELEMLLCPWASHGHISTFADTWNTSIEYDGIY